MDKVRRYGGLEEFVYEAVRSRVSMPKDEFVSQLKQWELKPVEIDGTLAAVVMVNRNEVHVAVKPDFKGKWMKRGSVIRGILAPILEQYGEIVTSVSFDNEAGRAFVERIGFIPSGVTYRLEKLVHA